MDDTDRLFLLTPLSLSHHGSLIGHLIYTKNAPKFQQRIPLLPYPPHFITRIPLPTAACSHPYLISPCNLLAHKHLASSFPTHATTRVPPRSVNATPSRTLCADDATAVLSTGSTRSVPRVDTQLPP